MYGNGHGVEQNWEKAAEMYLKAAEKGDVTGQANVGLCYYQGKGFGKNLKEAAKWFQKAADQGNERARNWLNEMAVRGELY